MTGRSSSPSLPAHLQKKYTEKLAAEERGHRFGQICCAQRLRNVSRAYNPKVPGASGGSLDKRNLNEAIYNYEMMSKP